jgi:hypothetical protein
MRGRTGTGDEDRPWICERSSSRRDSIGARARPDAPPSPKSCDQERQGISIRPGPAWYALADIADKDGDYAGAVARLERGKAYLRGHAAIPLKHSATVLGNFETFDRTVTPPTSGAGRPLIRSGPSSARGSPDELSAIGTTLLENISTPTRRSSAAKNAKSWSRFARRDVEGAAREHRCHRRCLRSHSRGKTSAASAVATSPPWRKRSDEPHRLRAFISTRTDAHALHPAIWRTFPRITLPRRPARPPRMSSSVASSNTSA